MFGGLGAIALAAPAGPLVVGALFGSCVTLVALSPLGRASGAHLNPAVTLAFRAMGKIGSRDAGGYVAAQLLGAIAGSALFRLLFGRVAGGTTHVSVPVPSAIALEAAMTAALVAIVFWFGARPRIAHLTPYAIPPVIALLSFAGAGATGASLNPARSFGPAVVFGDVSGLWVYLTAPVLGGLAIAWMWGSADPGAGIRRIRPKRTTEVTWQM
jgi:aquaporin Z